MMKFKLFFKSVAEEEDWINMTQKKGFRFTGINLFLPSLYYFKNDKIENNKLIKMDFKKYMSREKYIDYITLFEDSGWKHINGSRWGGLHYFQQLNSNTSSEIFSDNESKTAMANSYYKYASEYAFIFIIYFFILINITPIDILNPQSWYLTPGLWEMNGKLFWLAFLFETPFVLLRILPLFYILIAGIYYMSRAVKPKIEDNQP